MSHEGAAVGIADHAGWAVAVTATARGAVLDRRRVELVGAGLPCLPHHHEAQGLPTADAEQLIARVRASAEAKAKASVDAIAAAVSEPIVAVAIRACPPLPPSVAERISDYRAQCVADTVMYRTALAEAASAKAWRVQWYQSKKVLGEAARVLELDEVSFGSFLKGFRDSLGPPWQKDHRVALAAAIVALDEMGGGARRAVAQPPRRGGK